jgi:hypothetical protein
MTSDDAILIPYRTQKIVPRDGILGSLLRACAARPVLMGFLGGLGVNLIAFLKSPGVLESAPAEAALLGLSVMAAWVVLFRGMQSFFLSMSVMEIGVVRALVFDGETFTAYEGEAVRMAVPDPAFSIVSSAPVPPEVLEDQRSADQPWRAFLVAGNEDARFVIETRLAAKEASLYPVEDLKADEVMPTPLISGLLEKARQAAGH